jgi:DNA-binding protein HU-beta
MPNKADLIDTIANAADLSKSQASGALDALLGDISSALAKGERVAIAGFGTFQISERAARQGRNPQTGAVIQIKASKNVRFKSGKQLKDAIN